MYVVSIIFVLIVGYCLGSVSFAVLIARSQGVNILKVGSKNPGATNVKRLLGSRWGNIVFGLDLLKGCIAAGWPLLLLNVDLNGDPRPETQMLLLGVLGLFGAIMGHSYSFLLNFRGGKGVATTMGGLLALMPQVLAVGLIVWVIVFYASRVVAIASICFAVSLPLGAFLKYGSWDLRFAFGVLLALLIVVRHRSNIQRLMRGEENSFKK